MTQIHRTYAWQDRVRTRSSGIALAGYGVIIAVCGSFGIWAATAPLAEATNAPGITTVAGANTIVQHLDGGVVKAVLAMEGDRVKRGEPLLALDSTLAESQLSRLSRQLLALQIKAARLASERDGAATMALPATADPTSPATAAILEAETKEFSARLARFNAENEILAQRIGSLKEAVRGLRAQKHAADGQILLISSEADRKKGLLDKGLTNRSEYSELLRSNAGLVGQAGQIEAQIASTIIQLAEAAQQIQRQTTSRVEQAASELNETSASMADIEEQIVTARAVLHRMTVRAPADGIVIRSTVTSTGAVIMPGAALMEILPTDAELIVEARVKPEEVDKVHLDQPARMRFRSLNARTTPEIAGKVYYVSADRLSDSKTGQPYYAVRLKIAGDAQNAVPLGELIAGMPVDSSIATGQRTFLQYLAQPMLESLSKAFAEE